jgi:hypothetical protein
VADAFDIALTEALARWPGVARCEGFRGLTAHAENAHLVLLLDEPGSQGALGPSALLLALLLVRLESRQGGPVACQGSLPAVACLAGPMDTLQPVAFQLDHCEDLQLWQGCRGAGQRCWLSKLSDQISTGRSGPGTIPCVQLSTNSPAPCDVFVSGNVILSRGSALGAPAQLGRLGASRGNAPW